MKYPDWFPVPQAWLRAVIVFLSLIPCAVLWRTFAPILEIPERLAARRSPVAMELAWDIFVYWFLILGLLAPIVINVVIGAFGASQTPISDFSGGFLARSVGWKGLMLGWGFYCVSSWWLLLTW